MHHLDDLVQISNTNGTDHERYQNVRKPWRRPGKAVPQLAVKKEIPVSSTDLVTSCEVTQIAENSSLVVTIPSIRSQTSSAFSSFRQTDSKVNDTIATTSSNTFQPTVVMPLEAYNKFEEPTNEVNSLLEKVNSIDSPVNRSGGAIEDQAANTMVEFNQRQSRSRARLRSKETKIRASSTSVTLMGIRQPEKSSPTMENSSTKESTKCPDGSTQNSDSRNISSSRTVANSDVPQTPPIAAPQNLKRKTQTANENDSDEKKQKLPSSLNMTLAEEEEKEFSPQAQQKNTIKNNKIEMYASNPKYSSKCVVCGIKHPSVVSHYIRKHPQMEVFISRLSPKALDVVIQGVKQCAVVIPTFCAFCENHKKGSKNFWLTHFSQHTGEYIFKCNKCEQIFPTKYDHTKCDDTHFKKIKNIAFEDDRLYGYVCKMCNYVQFERSTVVRHIRDQHDVGDDAEVSDQCLKLMFLDFNTKRCVDRSVIKNTNKEMYAKNTTYSKECVLCGETKDKMVNHYVKYHPSTEVFISRVSTEIFNKLLVPGGLKKATSATSGVTSFCVFCEKDMKHLRQGWITHLTSHTGEYLYQCNKCEMPISNQDNHRKKKSCNSKSLQVLNIYIEDDGVYGYVCKLCHYVQFFEENLLKHVKRQHDIEEAAVSHQYFKIKILNFNQNDDDETSAVAVTSNNQPELEVEVFEADPEFSPANPNKDDALVVEETVVVVETDKENMAEVEENAVPETIQDYDESTQLASDNDNEHNLSNESFDDESTLSLSGIHSQSTSSNTARKLSQNDSGFQPGESRSSSISRESSGPIQNSIKPWTESISLKNQEITSFLLRDASLFALFKCMANDCYFTSNSAEIMQQHLNVHYELQNNCYFRNYMKPQEDLRYLECAYCTKYVETSQDLIQHIVEEHSNSAFQCQYCFYRSADVFSVFIHLEKYHSTEKMVILVCPTDLRDLLSCEVYLLGDFKRNVKPINCYDGCPKYFVIDQFIWHVKHCHVENNQFRCAICEEMINYSSIENHMLHHGFGDFQCLYCEFGGTLDGIRLHMANDHSNRLQFVCARKYRRHQDATKVDPMDLASTIIVNVSEEVDASKVQFRRCLLPETELNSVSFLACINDKVDFNQNVESIQSTSAVVPSARLEDILRRVIFKKSFKDLFSMTDFRNRYMKWDTSEICQQLERKCNDNSNSMNPIV